MIKAPVTCKRWRWGAVCVECNSHHQLFYSRGEISRHNSRSNSARIYHVTVFCCFFSTPRKQTYVSAEGLREFILYSSEYKNGSETYIIRFQSRSDEGSAPSHAALVSLSYSRQRKFNQFIVAPNADEPSQTNARTRWLLTQSSEMGQKHTRSSCQDLNGLLKFHTKNP